MTLHFEHRGPSRGTAVGASARPASVPPSLPTNPGGTFAPLPEWEPRQPRPADWPPHIHPSHEVAVGDKETLR